MPEMEIQTEAPIPPDSELVDDKEALDMYAAFKKEHPAAKLTAGQFKQILIMRRREVAEEKRHKDTSHIQIDENVLQRKPEEVKEAAQREATAQAERSSARTAQINSRVSKLLAELHGYLPPDQQAELQAHCKGALGTSPPSVSMPVFANKVIELCRAHAPDDERGLDVEIGFRESFAEVLACAPDAFDADSGGMPRKIFAHMMAKRRREEKALLARGVGDDNDCLGTAGPSMLESLREEDEVVDNAPPTGFGGSKGDYMRDKLMQIPADKREKMLRGANF